MERSSDEDCEKEKESSKKLEKQKIIKSKSVSPPTPAKQADKKISTTSSKTVKAEIKKEIPKNKTEMNEVLVKKESDILNKAVKPASNNNTKNESCKAKQYQSNKIKNVNDIRISQRIEVSSDSNSNFENNNQQEENQNNLISIKNGNFHDNNNVCRRKNCNCKKKHIFNTMNEDNQLNIRKIPSTDRSNSYQKADNKINIDNYVSKKNIIDRKERSERPDDSNDELQINDIRKADPTEPDCEEAKRKSANSNEESSKRGEKPTNYIKKKTQIETNDSENCDSKEEENMIIKKSMRNEKNDDQTDYGKNNVASSSNLRRTSYDQNESMKKESDLSEEECDQKEEIKLKETDKIILEKNPAPENINLANINNINVIEAKNTLNNVQKVYKNQIKTENNNLIFNNHIMVNGLVETSTLTGGCLIPLDKLMKVINTKNEINVF